jgi:hypothetical protein
VLVPRSRARFPQVGERRTSDRKAGTAAKDADDVLSALAELQSVVSEKRPG